MPLGPEVPPIETPAVKLVTCHGGLTENYCATEIQIDLKQLQSERAAFAD